MGDARHRPQDRLTQGEPGFSSFSPAITQGQGYWGSRSPRPHGGREIGPQGARAVPKGQSPGRHLPALHHRFPNGSDVLYFSLSQRELPCWSNSPEILAADHPTTTRGSRRPARREADQPLPGPGLKRCAHTHHACDRRWPNRRATETHPLVRPKMRGHGDKGRAQAMWMGMGRHLASGSHGQRVTMRVATPTE